MPGNVTNVSTFDFPVHYLRVPGANYMSVITAPTRELLSATIAAAKEFEQQGACCITTSCGFNALFQGALARAVRIPVFARALLQIPLVHRMLGGRSVVGVLTADAPNLKRRHFRSCGISRSMPLRVAGIERTAQFEKIRGDPSADLNPDQFVSQVVDVALDLIRNNKSIGAIVLECTDLPPAADEIHTATGLPVFDIVTLAHYVYAGVAAGATWPGRSDDALT